MRSDDRLCGTTVNEYGVLLSRLSPRCREIITSTIISVVVSVLAAAAFAGCCALAIDPGA
jgi:hypothetical protein